MPEDWKKLQIPAGLVVSFLVVFGGFWAYLHSEFVNAQEFKAAIQSIEVRSLERDKKQLETEVFKLEVKKEALPAKFDPVDKALLEKHKEDLKEVHGELKALKATLTGKR